jgi:hypothetical protein
MTIDAFEHAVTTRREKELRMTAPTIASVRDVRILR